MTSRANGSEGNSGYCIDWSAEERGSEKGGSYFLCPIGGFMVTTALCTMNIVNVPLPEENITSGHENKLNHGILQVII